MFCIYRCFNTQNYIYPFQNLSLGFILKIFLKFRKFQPRYSYNIYSYKKRVYQSKMVFIPRHKLQQTLYLNGLLKKPPKSQKNKKLHPHRSEKGSFIGATKCVKVYNHALLTALYVARTSPWSSVSHTQTRSTNTP